MVGKYPYHFHPYAWACGGGESASATWAAKCQLPTNIIIALWIRTVCVSAGRFTLHAFDLGPNIIARTVDSYMLARHLCTN